MDRYLEHRGSRAERQPGVISSDDAQVTHERIEKAVAQIYVEHLTRPSYGLLESSTSSPHLLTGSRSEGGEAPCPVAFSIRGARRRTCQYVEHPEEGYARPPKGPHRAHPHDPQATQNRGLPADC